MECHEDKDPSGKDKFKLIRDKFLEDLKKVRLLMWCVFLRRKGQSDSFRHKYMGGDEKDYSDCLTGNELPVVAIFADDLCVLILFKYQ